MEWGMGDLQRENKAKHDKRRGKYHSMTHHVHPGSPVLSLHQGWAFFVPVGADL